MKLEILSMRLLKKKRMYKTQHYEINAFQFWYDSMPDWFMDQISSGDVVLLNCDYTEYSTDKAFCIINAKSPYKRVCVSAGEYILESDYNELIKMHPDNFITKYEKINNNE